MQNYIQELFVQKLPRSKPGPGGWLSHNCMACIHNGQARPDTRKRGGLQLNSSGGFVTNCFNCSYSTSWTPGQLLSKKAKNLLIWLGATPEEIKTASFEAMKIKEFAHYNKTNKKVEYVFNYNKVELPNGSRKLSEWASEETQDPKFIQALEYISNRNPNYFSWFNDFYWSPELPERVIIPLLHDEQIYGWTARLTRKQRVKAELKYKMNEGQTKFLFNADKLFVSDRNYVILVEGIFDAIAVSGVATQGNLLTEHQVKWINDSGKKVIVLPDKDEAGQKLIDFAIANKWYVSFPDIFNKNIKDAADAVNVYGRLMTIKFILDSKENNKMKINMIRKDWK